ncbi:MAG: hypothetical protein HQ559_14130 [Lentisphaerae bacterium]|nr:hypothetical protein [Lentisphaerota bacterium]
MRAKQVLCWMMVVAVVSGLCVGCDRFKPKPPPPPMDGETESKLPDVDGEWRVSWENGNDSMRDFNLNLAQDDEDLEGSADFGSLSWDVAGEVESDGDVEFTLEVMVLGQLAAYEFEGEVDSPTKMSGTWKDVGAHPMAPPENAGDWEALKDD